MGVSRLGLLLLFVMLLGGAARAQAPVPPAPVVKPGTSQEKVQADISTRQITIQSNFTGIEILIFGSVDFSDARMPASGTYDVIAVVRGPNDSVVVRKKTRVAGLWINGPGKTYTDIPSFYAVLSSRPIRAIASDDTLRELGIGLSALDFSRDTAGSPQEQSFKSALIRLMEERNLYTVNDSGVVFIGRSLFRGTVALPVNLSTGLYLVDVYLFRDGDLASRTNGSLEVTKAGMEATIYNLAFHKPFLYGLLGIAIAVLAGLMGWFAFRRD
ncbi:hypothetical protein AUC68_02780 [Methyloceanibacter methanicus]|uniref:Transmembrane protein n=1 Tax=Methyloceanibacter methanicus TaxID=1774968 RepID=A0A1E3W4K0_9HYPH|nr:TIGR02186 family protein [Methyloceanibacter methanicus]ODS00067.1 hypothetical protein AUC68_02780 [Methyloceanibacter methanicus]